jgi:hypothetical protein
MRRAPDGWLYFECGIEDSGGDTLLVYVCSGECANLIWHVGPGPRWTQEELAKTALSPMSHEPLGPIRTRLGETKGPPIQDIPDERRIWYVHVNECGGVWHLVSGGPLPRADADALADELRERGIIAYIGTDWEKRGL